MNSQVKIRKHLLDVSENLFVEHGYTATTTRMIAESSGINIAMINYYFVSKENLLDLVVTRILKRLSTGIKIWRYHTCCGNPWQRLQTLIGLTAGFYRFNQALTGFLIESIRRLERANQQRKAAYCLFQYSSFVNELVTAGKHEGLFHNAVDTDTLVALLLSFRNCDMLTTCLWEDRSETSLTTESDRLHQAVKKAITAYLF